jgi:hypothetical protein
MVTMEKLDKVTLDADKYFKMVEELEELRKRCIGIRRDLGHNSIIGNLKREIENMQTSANKMFDAKWDDNAKKWCVPKVINHEGNESIYSVNSLYKGLKAEYSTLKRDFDRVFSELSKANDLLYKGKCTCACHDSVVYCKNCAGCVVYAKKAEKSISFSTYTPVSVDFTPDYTQDFNKAVCVCGHPNNPGTHGEIACYNT